jgi:hypothetical protein
VKDQRAKEVITWLVITAGLALLAFGALWWYGKIYSRYRGIGAIPIYLIPLGLLGAALVLASGVTALLAASETILGWRNCPVWVRICGLLPGAWVCWEIGGVLLGFAEFIRDIREYLP